MEVVVHGLASGFFWPGPVARVAQLMAPKLERHTTQSATAIPPADPCVAVYTPHFPGLCTAVQEFDKCTPRYWKPPRFTGPITYIPYSAHRLRNAFIINQRMASHRISMIDSC
jgi:hypothetical protein